MGPPLEAPLLRQFPPVWGRESCKENAFVQFIPPPMHAPTSVPSLQIMLPHCPHTPRAQT
eukprot:scaffold79203_cov23-Tisochrysis_lutea.AAC.1